MRDAVASAYAHCAALAKHYENFPVGSLLVPRRMRPHVHAVYAFARGADDIADEGTVAPAERISRLTAWELALTDAVEGRDGAPVFLALADTILRFNIPLQLFRDLLSAFRQDVTVHRYAAFPELLDYCTRSANPVGRIILHLAGVHTVEAWVRSDSICTALQLTNFWQDIAVDWTKGRVYLPLEDCARFGIAMEELGAPVASSGLRSLLAFEVERTAAMFAAGAPLLSHLHGRVRMEIAATIGGGVAILRHIREANFEVLAKRPRLTSLDMAGIVVRALCMRPSGV
jgi:squalene synthase HpnC